MSSSLRRELAGIALLLLAVFVAGALLFQPLPDAESCFAAGGVFGPVGACVKQGLLTLVGGTAAALLPLAAAVHGLRLMGRTRSSTDRSWMIFLLGLALLVPIGLGLTTGANPDATPVSGLWGSFLAYYLRAAFGAAGAWIVLALGGSALMAWTLRWNPIRAIVGSAASSRTGAVPPNETLAQRLEPPPQEMPGIEADAVNRDAPAAEEVGARRRRTARTSATASDAGGRDDGMLTIPGEGASYDEMVPPTDLLAQVPQSNVEVSRRELDAMGRKLMDALRTFRVDGDLVGRTTGPVVTQFEIEPAPGVKVRQFANLANDLALAMRAPSIRVVAPIPGRGAVGVEVPNPTAEIVSFRELVESREFQECARVAADRARQGSRGASGGRRSRQDAAPPHRRRDGLGQVGLREHDHHEPGLPAHAADAAFPDDRPEDGRAVGVQSHAASALSRRHRQPRRRVVAQVGGDGDARPLPPAGRERRPQYPGIQQARAGGRARWCTRRTPTSRSRIVRTATASSRTS